MATLPIIKKFLTEDFKSQEGWIGNLFYPLNLLLNTIYTALSNGITFQQNMMTQLKTVPMTASSPVVSFPYQYSPASPIGMLVINVTQTSSPVVGLSTAVGCTWVIVSGVLTVTVQGLTKGQSYNVTFLVIGG